MLESDLPAAPPGAELPADLVEVGAYRNLAEGAEHGLVVLAMNHPYWLLPMPDAVRLLVDPRIAPEARRQLGCYERERIGWPPRPPDLPIPARPTHYFTPLLWAFGIMAMFQAQAHWPGLAGRGALDARAMADSGEWWRAGTALFLHADVGHLVSNVVSGVFVFAAVTTTIGIWRGWALTLIAAVAANSLNAVVTASPDYRSLGASTAIFAGLGLLTGRAVGYAGRRGHPHRARSALVPLVAGATLLALFGGGGLRTDIGAHLVGFAAGFILGFIAGVDAARARPNRGG